MKDWWYSDPLDAAWMLRRFGLQTFTQSRWGKPCVLGLDELLLAANLSHAACPETRYKVHEASLHLLEPKPGDVVELRFGDERFFDVVALVIALDKGLTLLGKRHVYDLERYKFYVVERAGNAFIWPGGA